MTQIGRYEIVRRTGQTPLGTIYEAVDRETQRTVAIQATEDACSESLGRLNHPNIRNLIAVEQADGRLFLILEHMDALPILEYARAQNATPADLAKLLKTAAMAVDHANEQGVSHPGLTPKHLLVNTYGLLKIAGFELPGLDALAFPSTNDAEREELEFSVPYRAPEFLAGEYDLSRADQFALGAIAFELLTGRRLFESGSPVSTMADIISGKSSDLALVEAKSSVAVRRVLERMIGPDPAMRFASCTLAMEALDSALVRKVASPTRVTDSPVLVRTLSDTDIPRVRQTPLPPIGDRIAKARQANSQRLRWVIAGVVVSAVAMAALILGQVMHRPAPPVAHQTSVAPVPEKRSNPTSQVQPSPPVVHPSDTATAAPSQAARTSAAKPGKRKGNTKATVYMPPPSFDSN
jgi:serine/threonine protein kinase